MKNLTVKDINGKIYPIRMTDKEASELPENKIFVEWHFITKKAYRILSNAFNHRRAQ